MDRPGLTIIAPLRGLCQESGDLSEIERAAQLAVVQLDVNRLRDKRSNIGDGEVDEVGFSCADFGTAKFVQNES